MSGKIHMQNKSNDNLNYRNMVVFNVMMRQWQMLHNKQPERLKVPSN
ncbi:unnamed protein product [Trifolium pratense]|uniref:Uncharacterized protein n=1 Tax=Trifolium pratense TaxID=57577 RepID=A0ACB0LU15_TRIPR|nr:unnamed protein product [Trifolium pratense]